MNKINEAILIETLTNEITRLKSVDGISLKEAKAANKFLEEVDVLLCEIAHLVDELPRRK